MSSSSLVWQLVKGHHAHRFQARRGVQFSNEAGNVLNINSANHTGYTKGAIDIRKKGARASTNKTFGRSQHTRARTQARASRSVSSPRRRSRSRARRSSTRPTSRLADRSTWLSATSSSRRRDRASCAPRWRVSRASTRRRRSRPPSRVTVTCAFRWSRVAPWRSARSVRSARRRVWPRAARRPSPMPPPLRRLPSKNERGEKRNGVFPKRTLM